MGLLSPQRAGDRRRYDADDLYRIAVVVNAKRAGLSLEDIRELYQASDGESRKEILRQHQSALRKRIAEAQAALDLVNHGIDCEHEDFIECPRFRRAVSALIDPTAPSEELK